MNATKRLILRTTGLGRLTRKVIRALTLGTLAFFITNLFTDDNYALLVSVFIGGALLVVELLTELDQRLAKLEESQGVRLGEIEEAQVKHVHTMEALVQHQFSKINEATQLFGLVEASAVRTDVVVQLVRHSTQIGPEASPIVSRFAQAEISRMSDFLKELGSGGNVMYEGEDRDWMLGLTRAADHTIDATSLTTVDARGRRFIDDGLWSSDLGQRYLEAQRAAVVRGVRIRRVFILERREFAADKDFLDVCRVQRDMGIEVRVLDPSTVPDVLRSSLFDFVLFDQAISYEATPASQIEDGARPVIVNTRLEQGAQRVQDRIARFGRLWSSARVFDDDYPNL